MNDSGAERKYPIVPPSELRCVWMTAGVLSYQLCDRKFECEECPLDLALRQRLIQREAERVKNGAGMNGALSGKTSSAILYSRGHVWVRAGEERTVRVGIEPGLASVLVSPKAVVLPAVGEQVIRNKVCSWIVLEGGTLPIVSPLSGRVRFTNSRLAENPHALCMSPLGQGWLFELTVEEVIERNDSLMPVEEVAGLYQEDERRFQSLLSAELTRGGDKVGVTLADGGQPLSNFPEMLGPTKYFKIVRNVFT